MNNDEFHLIAVTRDLNRRPEIKHLAMVLFRLADTHNTGEIPPLYYMQAKTIIDNRRQRQTLFDAIEICKKG